MTNETISIEPPWRTHLPDGSSAFGFWLDELPPLVLRLSRCLHVTAGHSKSAGSGTSVQG
jgi:hypothetical protein